jgi:hypothetical protein
MVATLEHEVAEESRATYALTSESPDDFSEILSVTVGKNQLTFVSTTQFELQGDWPPDPPENREEGEMLGVFSVSLDTFFANMTDNEILDVLIEQSEGA